MSKKAKRRWLQLFGFLTGLLFGYFRAQQIQSLFPVLGISVGIGYFLLSKTASDKDKDLDDIAWFIPLQMIMYFIIGGALSSSIVLAIELYTN
ncbi:hypothetical protein [Alkalibacterium olivapovliticus]|uniref:Uncharacterized protein n=1 Tax=Alkalibacterium olivapovliticus TaxID=99907 RepID=A0A2T0WA91_9LACT|nr:hypothetical protein [Alkalibacterium olivapovliticus]PRY83434.1 hypothetical protein CLV38_10440 [Alkalibacterium olivapovliticus]